MSATGADDGVRRTGHQGVDEAQNVKDETNPSAEMVIGYVIKAVRTCQAPDEVQWYFILIFEYAPT